MRLQIRLSGVAEKRFLEMAERLNVDHREIVLDALALYDFATTEVADGRKIGSFDPESKEFTAMTTTIFQSLAQSRRPKGMFA